MNGDNNWDGAGTGHSSDGDSSGRDGGLSDLLYRGRLDVMDPLSAAYKQAPEYLTDEAEDRTFEKMSYRIGIAYLAGVSTAGMYGMVEGIRYADRTTTRLRVNGILNAMVRRGVRAGNAMGVATLMFGLAEAAVAAMIDRDNVLTKPIAGAMTGLLYKSTAGPQRALLGAAVGCALATAFTFATYITGAIGV